MRLLFAVGVAIAFLFASCGDEGDNAVTPTPAPTATLLPTGSSSSTPSAFVTPTPLPSPAASPVPLPTLPPTDSPERLVFVRSPADPNQIEVGELWVSDLAGNNAQRLTAEGVKARFVALTGDPLTSSGYVYYIADMTDDSATIYRRHFPGGSPERVLSFEPWAEYWAYASLAPDERRLAFSDRYGLHLLDLDTYHIDHLAAGGDKGGCGTAAGGIAACTAYSSMSWSPDGALLAAREVFWESGRIVIVSPGSEPVEAGNCCGGDWSPDGGAVCSFGQYGGSSALYIARAPDWTKQAYLQEFEAGTVAGANQPSVSSCSWLNDSTVTVGINLWSDVGQTASCYIASVDASSGSVRRVTPDAPAPSLIDTVIAAPGAGLVFVQYRDPFAGNMTGHAAIDIGSGQTYGVLTNSDMLTAIVTPE